MIQIKDLTITHKKDSKILLEKFSCVLNDGDKAVILGEEGDGKSTLLKWIYCPAYIENYTESRGERILNHEKLAYLPQELDREDAPKTVYEFLSEEPLFWNRTAQELAKLAYDLFLPVDICYSDQKMETLSGGEKIKVQVMRLLISDPTVLLMDEPSNDIDMETMEWLEKMICAWPHIVLFVSHDELFIENTANMVIHLEQINRKTKSRFTVSHKPYTRYVAERKEAFQKQEMIALNDRREKKIRDEKFRRIEQSVAYKLDNISKADRDMAGRLLKKKMKAVKSLEKRFEREDENMTEMPEQEDAIFIKFGGNPNGIPAKKTVLDYRKDTLYAPDGKLLAKDIHLLVRGSEKIGIVGKNGAGKTTLLREIVAALMMREDIRVEYMPQNYDELLALDKTPVGYLERVGDKEEKTRIRTFLGALKFTAGEMDHPIRELSGGQKAKILLLKMCMSEANVLVLDEPTRNFSPLSGPVIRKMLSQFPGAIVSVSHDRKYLSEVCEKKYYFSETGLSGK